ncbi:hypothetical protein BT69DRAFT_1276681 [Atractiella rhizophila]|nr:hypothetical protein BT69DRAFT_1276681 [Atractiella rhizophila]
MAKSSVFHSVLRFLTSPTTIAAFKGTLAYVLVLLLIFLDGSRKFLDFPVAYTSAVVVTIAGFPGKAVGACLMSVTLAVLGVCLGCLNFFILAKLWQWPVAQGFVFAFMLYILNFIKSKGLLFFGFSLLCILMSFNGIYTSLLVGGFNVNYMTSYLKAYLWGGAIVVFVNVFVFPRTSERELRQTLDLSLEHIRIFSHLLAKTYSLTITPEEVKIRDELNASIRADIGVLQAKLGESLIEINYSKWSLNDYRQMVAKTREMQQSLLATWSSLNGVENQDIEYFRDHFVDSAKEHFGQLRRDVHISITEIRRELAVGEMVTTKEQEDLAELDKLMEESSPIDQSKAPSIYRTNASSDDDDKEGEKKEDDGTRIRRSPTTLSGLSSAQRRALITDLQQRLAEEVGVDESTNGDGNGNGSATDLESGSVGKEEKEKVCRSDKLWKDWGAFEKVTYDLIGDSLSSGQLVAGHEDLLVETPLPSLKDLWGYDVPNPKEAREMFPNVTGKHVHHHLRPYQQEGARTSSRRVNLEAPNPAMVPKGRRGSALSSLSERRVLERRESLRKEEERRDSISGVIDDVMEEEGAEEEAENSHHSLVRVYSWLFAMRQFSHALKSMHELTTEEKREVGKRRRKGIHFHIFESIRRDNGCPEAKQMQQEGKGKGLGAEISKEKQGKGIDQKDVERELSMREALALLEGREYTPEKVTIWHRYSRLEGFLRSPDSIYAIKATAAVIIYASLYWSTTTRAWFTHYTLTGGLITVVVALSPTLGQSLITFIFQVLGQGVGLIVGMTLCYIFRDVGGYKYNPYGLLPLMAVYAFILSYFLYAKPQFFVAPFLALNSAALVVAFEYIYTAVPHFDDPHVRLYKGLTSLAIALGIVAVFQLVILRNPARRTLRKVLAQITYQNLSYSTILSAFVRANLSADPQVQSRPDEKASTRVYLELIRRENKIQSALVNIMPLVMFSQSEHSFTKPFQAKHWLRIIRANQIILDRHRDGRLAVGVGPTAEIISKHFVTVLSPYRRRNIRLLRGAFYAITTSLTSKIPLPSELPKTKEVLPAFIHDALVLSSRIAKTDEGKELVRSEEFTRYWFYLLSATSIGFQLEEMEAAMKAMYGELEDDPNLG